ARQFLSAAGVDHSRIDDSELGPIMERTGIAFRTLVEGAREVLMARASIKDELRLGQTMISPDGNNPIKFSISGQQAVEAMIKPTVAGYQAADKAAAEAMMDIKAHEVAMMSGMESAIKTLLSRFDPAELATRIEDSGRLGGLLKGKKAQYWDVFEKLYKQLSEDAEEDFNTLFGKEFAKAYKDQLQKLKSN
ncbi:MAG: type VI secretion system-associated FHA domain protein TagH, partial [Rhodobacteraceae bacterium]|nr:type VI secretion system-associated FHA domain protein TagH [Paracoccaceae bacterium]